MPDVGVTGIIARMDNASSNSDTLFCANHPDRETLLRCNRCEKPICIQCAIQTPTGYRCKECVRGQQQKFNTARVSDLIIAPVIALILSYIGSLVTNFVGFFTLFAAPLIAMGIERVIRLFIKNRRSNALFIASAIGCALGGLPSLLFALRPFLGLLNGAGVNLLGLNPLIWRGAYLVLVTSALYYRLKGISFR